MLMKKPQLVFLDAATIDQGDLDWVGFENLGDITRYEVTSDGETPSRIKAANVVVTNKVKIQREHFEAAPDLKLVAVLATGYDIIDREAARDHGVTVCHVPAYSTESVAQTTFALLLELAMQVGEYSAECHQGKWSASPHFSAWKPGLVELAGKTHVVVGYGHIGKRVAEISSAFGLRVVLSSSRGTHHQSPYESLPLDQALAQADVVSLHCPLTPENQGMVNAEWLSSVKPDALLINVARGGLIHEPDLANALHAGQLGGYAADVLAVEPPPSDHPLLISPRTILTPHMAWATQESRQRLWSICQKNVAQFLSGQAQNVVS